MNMEDRDEAINWLLDRSCETCIFNDNWDHPHNGDTVKDCRINGPRKQGWCDHWNKGPLSPG